MQRQSTTVDDHHHHHHRPNRLNVPSRASVTGGSAFTSFPYTPTPTPSKTRLSFSARSSHGSSKSSISFLFLVLFSLRSLFSLFTVLRSSPYFSLFPFSFLVSLLSFLLSLAFSLFPGFSRSRKDPFFRQNNGGFSLASLSPSQRKLLFGKSMLLAVVFLVRFQALRYCGAAAMILAELSGTVAARFVSETQNRNSSDRRDIGSSKVRGFCFLFVGLSLLSISWDRVECFPFSSSSAQKWGLWLYPSEKCIRIWPTLLPFMSGFLGCYEKIPLNWGTIGQLDQKRVRLISLFFTTLILFIPAVVSFMFFEGDDDSVSIGNLAWPLANTVVFGVLLTENHTGGASSEGSNEFEREFLVIFLCTIVLELFYFPDLSLWGLLCCGFLLYIAVRNLDSIYSEPSESYSSMVMKPIHHILSEKKSRKIAMFLMINTAYMVVEFTVGFMSNSLGLISDACHMLFDCAALAIGLYASYISRLPANHQFNYGRGRFEVLSGYVNAVFLVLVGALIVLESIERILDPQEISTNSLLVVSVGGLVVNLIGLVFFHDEHHHAHGGSGCSHSHHHDDSHQHEHHEAIVVPSDHHHHHDCHDHDHNHGSVNSEIKEKTEHEDHRHHHHQHRHIDHNMEGIFLHVLADTMGSVGVVISTLLIKYKGWMVADPACSIFISVLIIASVIPLLRNSGEILLQRIPKGRERDLREAVRNILKTRGVRSIQRLHVWSFTNSDIVATLHLLVSADSDKAAMKRQVSSSLNDAGVKDLTLQVECVNS